MKKKNVMLRYRSYKKRMSSFLQPSPNYHDLDSRPVLLRLVSEAAHPCAYTARPIRFPVTVQGFEMDINTARLRIVWSNSRHSLAQASNGKSQSCFSETLWIEPLTWVQLNYSVSRDGSFAKVVCVCALAFVLNNSIWQCSCDYNCINGMWFFWWGCLIEIECCFFLGISSVFGGVVIQSVTSPK